jgi:succinyl-CoA synthetase alpha subunit
VAVERTGANTAMIFVPPRVAADSILEAEDAGIALIVAITEGSRRTTSCASTTTSRATRACA